MSELSTISIMFEEIKQFIKQIINRVEKLEKSDDKNNVCTSDLSEIANYISLSKEEIVSKLEQIEQDQAVPKKVHHRISIDIQSSWVFLTIIGLSAFLVTSLVLCYKLTQENNALTDSDIKYRYIKMHNGIDSTNVYRLEDVFVYKRNEKIIKQIKSDVLEYERSVMERAQRLEQARRKEKQAEKLQEEAIELKK